MNPNVLGFPGPYFQRINTESEQILSQENLSEDIISDKFKFSFQTNFANTKGFLSGILTANFKTDTISSQILTRIDI